MRKTPLKCDLARNKNCSDFQRDIFNGYLGQVLGKCVLLIFVRTASLKLENILREKCDIKWVLVKHLNIIISYLRTPLILLFTV